MQILTPPSSFAIVTHGIFRSETPQTHHFSFLKTKDLRSVLILCPETPGKVFLSFCDEARINVIHIGAQTWKPHLGSKPVSEELVKEALEFALAVENHPVLVTCTSGVQETGIFVGCLRRLLCWSFNAIVVEYRAFAQHKARSVNEQFIEFYDTDLITLPVTLAL